MYDKEFNKKTLKELIKFLKEDTSKQKYIGDMSDFGNEIGYALGNVFPNMNDEDISMFITGFKHGVSLTNGTH